MNHDHGRKKRKKKKVQKQQQQQQQQQQHQQQQQQQLQLLLLLIFNGEFKQPYPFNSYNTMTRFHIHSAYYLAILYIFKKLCGGIK
ncbi:hypothetical protein E2C01_066855 [Portunus trituberculatus]|uniref:Uncharacterized protein n=1 Tax=Portunus trituberculatus TaxID=210409 RepID=A0A5B7HQZ2_PORTR|nr:hypothetical protein [Portunus trituberculatus]